MSDMNMSVNTKGIRTTTNNLGQYAIDLANRTDGYTVGSSYAVEVKDEFDNEFYSDSVTLEGESMTKNIFLDQRTKAESQNRNSETYQITHGANLLSGAYIELQAAQFSGTGQDITETNLDIYKIG